MKGLHRICAALFVLCQACAAWGYVQNSTFGGNPLHRTDFADVRYVINDQSVAGLVNRDGMPIITSDSSPAAAIQAAMDNWTNVPSSEVRFAPLEVTAAANPSSNRTNLVTFADTDRTRSILGMAVGITLLFWDGDGALTDTDILFNPRHSYSTTLRPDTFDIQATMTHELGHALGLDHSGVAGASMFAVAARQSNTLAILSADDIAFVTTIYPRLGSLQDLGVIRGRVERTTGGLVRGALVAAVSPTTGVIVGGGDYRRFRGLRDQRHTAGTVHHLCRTSRRPPGAVSAFPGRHRRPHSLPYGLPGRPACAHRGYSAPRGDPRR